ncbi:unnamed protein product [Protopolystoma xenopodis]|uniref:Uncharacterized protein n=1 Tax=Protopolystoma xenopodis TaxID=117903 RepID=A0A448X409_9PLAT|nr:unnamed protein product [Protopolystoma xenopodis]
MPAARGVRILRSLFVYRFRTDSQLAKINPCVVTGRYESSPADSHFLIVLPFASSAPGRRSVVRAFDFTTDRFHIVKVKVYCSLWAPHYGPTGALENRERDHSLGNSSIGPFKKDRSVSMPGVLAG